MIILRQREYATGVERAHIVMNKIPKPSIKDIAREKSVEKRKSAIKKINQALGKEGMERSSIGGFFRGKSIRARVRMGQVSPEAVERLRKRKLAAALKDQSTSPEAIEAGLRKTLGQKTKEAGKNLLDKTKNGVKALYVDTSGVAGRVAGASITHPGILAGNVVTTAVPFAFAPATCAKLQGISAMTHAGTGSGVASEWIFQDIPVRRALRDTQTGKKLRDASGKVLKGKPVPFSKIYGRWGRNFGDHIKGIYEGKPIKGSLKRIAHTVQESHRASHPYERRTIPVG